MNALNYFIKAHEMQPTHMECLSILGNYYLYEHNFKKAIVFFKKLDKIRENSNLHTDISTADNLTMLGLCMLNIEEIERAIEVFKKALDITKFLAKEVQSKSILSNGIENKSTIVSEVQIQIDLLNSKIYNNLGNAFRKVKDYDNSLRYYVMCLNVDNMYTYSTACFNLGTMLIAKGDFLPGLSYLEKALLSGNKEISTYITSKGLSFLFAHPNIKEAIIFYFKKKYNNSVIKLKEIYLQYQDNPIVNFFLAYDYLSLCKFEKSLCFFNKLLQLNIKHSYEKCSFLKKVITKAKLIVKKIPTMEKSVNKTYLKDMLSFVDFPYILEIEDYEDVIDESLQNKINTDLNIILKQTERTKRQPDGIITSYNELMRARWKGLK